MGWCPLAAPSIPSWTKNATKKFHLKEIERGSVERCVTSIVGKKHGENKYRAHCD